MRYFSPDSSELTGGDSSRRSADAQSADAQSADAVPSGMDNDPNADEEIINQDANDTSPRHQYPERVQPDTSPESTKLAPDNLADSIAYALDGTGPGPMNEKPNVSGHEVISEDTTDAE